MPEKTRKAIERGVQILLEKQESLEGLEVKSEWPYEGVYRVRRQIPIGYRVGGTAICAWALIEAPGFAGDERRREAVERATNFILEKLDDPRMQPHTESRYDVRNWGHAYALLFLSKLKERDLVPNSLDLKVKRSCQKLVRLLEKSEIPDQGGWNYARRPQRQSPSTFMTGSVIQSLAAASKIGVRVDAAVVERALESLEGSRGKNGYFQYARSSRSAEGELPGAIARMPICEVSLVMAGRGSVERIRASLDAFFEHWEWLEKRRKQTGTHVPPYGIAPYYFFYGHYYAAQAIEYLPEADVQKYRDQLLERLWQVQEKSGGWNDRIFPRSENFGTAMSVLALLEPFKSQRQDKEKSSIKKKKKKKKAKL